MKKFASFMLFVLVVALLVACSNDGSSNSVTNSDEDSSSSVAYVEPSRTDSVDLCEYGSLTDERDGKTYKTVAIGTQTWMAENLNYAYTGVPYKVDEYASDSTSWCYDNDPAKCSKYGRLYTWAAAMDSVGIWSKNGKDCGYGKTCSPTYPVRGVCPEGWHLPTKAEFETLFTAVGGSSTAGKMLKSTSGWNSSGNGTDAYAFSALPAGYRYDNGSLDGGGYYAFFWSSTERSSNYAYYIYLIYNYDIAYLFDNDEDYGFSVRCVKDESDAVLSSSSVTPKSSDSETSVSSSSVKSSSSAKSSSSVAYVEPCRTDSVDACEYGTLTDERDGQTYKTVTIGSQTWMAENLNYQTANSYCYDNIVYNSTTYGRLYTWAAAMDSVGIWSKNGKGCGYGKTYGKTCSPTYPVRGVCPEGWHLPTIAEFETLFTAVGGYSTADEMLKSTSGWNGSGNGTDSYAFSAKPAGYRDSSGSYYHWGYDAYFWSSAEKNGNYAYYMRLDYYDDYAYYMGMFYDDGAAYLIGRNKDRGFSVRCLKD